MDATPTANSLPLRYADFATLAEALDYAAGGETGCNFYSGKGELYESITYGQLRRQARQLARRLAGLGLDRGARVALVADTHPDFLRFFFACQYAGLVPVPLPASVMLGGHKAYVAQLQRLLQICRAAVAIAPDGFLDFLTEAAQGLKLRFLGGSRDFDELPVSSAPLSPSTPKELAYLQYTSGSTRFPRGVMITQQTVMSNLAAITKYGIKVRPEDRSVSWLPFYHDMGLVGLVLAAMASQLSVDYLNTRDFAMRPRLWLSLMSRNRGTLSISPPFGYELVARRVQREGADKYDLSAWRVAGVGAETIRVESLEKFAENLASSGFDRRAFLPCYGMAECSLAVSFAAHGRGVEVDCIDSEHLSEQQQALPVNETSGRVAERLNKFVFCGKPLPGYEIEIRDSRGNVLPERHCGTLFVRGPSVMSGYFGDVKATRDNLSPDGWLNTGDLAYRVGDNIVITGREKDLIIINGRNIWPQDLEYLAEQQPEIRIGNVSAFSVPGRDGSEKAVLMIEERESDDTKRAGLRERVHALVREELGIDCYIEFVPRHTLPRTTSGKLSRSGARKEFLKRVAAGQTYNSGTELQGPLFTGRAV